MTYSEETLKENSEKNLIWFHSLPEYEKQCLVDLISPIHYASVYHDELKRIYKKYSIDKGDETKNTLDNLFESLDSDLSDLKIRKEEINQPLTKIES